LASGSPGDRLAVSTATVAQDEADVRAFRKPGFDGRGLTIRRNVHDATPFEIADNAVWQPRSRSHPAPTSLATSAACRHRSNALTRKNFLFLGSDEGGRRAAIFYTVIASAKLNEIDPEAYMADVIDRMAKGHPINRLAELLPWNWKAVRAVSPQERRAA
jgi:hypothetical protein